MTATTDSTETDDHPATKEMERQVADKKREEDERLRRRISHEAMVYATIFDAVRLRMEPFTKWEERPVPNGPGKGVTVEKVPPLLLGSDLKDVATTIYIQLSRGVAWR